MSVCLSCSILCSSSRLPFNVRNFLANCSASCLVSVRSVSSSRFSLCMDSSDRAVTFSSISSSMFCSTRRREAISNIVTATDPPDNQGGQARAEPPTPAAFPSHRTGSALPLLSSLAHLSRLASCATYNH